MEFLVIILLVALLAAFVILLADKLKLIERVQVRGNDFFAEMFNCQFCLSFWTATIICVAAFLLLRDYRLLAVPFLSTPLTRKML
jgi:hypothetical protein